TTEISATLPINTSSPIGIQCETNDHLIVKVEPDVPLNIHSAHDSSTAHTVSEPQILNVAQSNEVRSLPNLEDKVEERQPQTIQKQSVSKIPSNGRFACEHCLKVFTYACRMRKHANSCRHNHKNLEEKPFTCSYCDARFASQRALAHHLRRSH